MLWSGQTVCIITFLMMNRLFMVCIVNELGYGYLGLGNMGTGMHVPE